jgi:hypothetical protein
VLSALATFQGILEVWKAVEEDNSLYWQTVWLVGQIAADIWIRLLAAYGYQYYHYDYENLGSLTDFELFFWNCEKYITG